MINPFRRLRELADRQRLLLKDIQANQFLRNLASEGNYFPATGSSLNAHSLATVVNDITINQRNSVIEFGAALSTLYIARLIRQLSLDTVLISVDDNEDWLDIIRVRLKEESLLDSVTLVHAPLKPCSHSIGSLDWYDEAAISVQTSNTAIFDVVLIDGPMAYRKPIELARYPALQYVSPRIGERLSVFLDDTHRSGEREVLRRWENEFELTFTKVNSAFSRATRGNAFNPVV